MHSIFKIVGSDKYGWCFADIPYGPERYSPMLKRVIKVGFSPGPTSGTFSRIPKKSNDVIGSPSGPLVSDRFVKVVEDFKLTGIRFHPVTLRDGSKIPACRWFVPEATSFEYVDISTFCGDDYQVCPVTGVFQKKDGVTYKFPLCKVSLLSDSRCDFFAMRNIQMRFLYMTSHCYNILTKAGLSVPVEEHPQRGKCSDK